jgi:hypothetical protein
VVQEHPDKVIVAAVKMEIMVAAVVVALVVLVVRLLEFL